MCQSCFTAIRAKARVAAFRLRATGAIPAKTWSGNTGVGLRHLDGPQRAVDCDVNPLQAWASAPDRGTVFSCREYQGMCGDP